MTDIHRLLAATDLSAPARHAAERAAILARELGARLDLLHVISASPVDRLRRLLAEAPADLEARLLGDARNDIERLGAVLRSGFGVPTQPSVVSGDLITAINAHARAAPADLVVLGARGASFMRHLLLGSTAERLVRKSEKPLLVVKQPPHEPYRRVLVAVDLSSNSLPALAAARAVAPMAELVVLHAYEVPFEDRLRSSGLGEEILDQYRLIAQRQALQGMRSLLAAAGLSPDAAVTLVMQGDPSSLVIEQEQERDCDLIVVGKHGESTLEAILLGSVTRHVLQASQGDVLVSLGAPLLAARAG
jgi:nucleotide-binding universal stress UspA family protein